MTLLTTTKNLHISMYIDGDPLKEKVVEKLRNINNKTFLKKKNNQE